MDKAKVRKDTFRLDRICVNDARLAAYGVAGGRTVPIATKGAGKVLCVELNGVQELPETCTCVPPAGGDCTPPIDGFVCFAAGRVPLAGG